MLIFIDHLQFNPVSGCVGRGPSALYCPGPTMLLRQPGITVKVSIVVFDATFSNISVI